MSTIIKADDGTEHDVYARITGGMPDVLVRANSRQEWIDAALGRSLLVEVTDEDGTVSIVPSPGVHVHEPGPVMLTAGEYDADGNEITAPTWDTRHHVNVRISGSAVEALDDTGSTSWKNTIIHWTKHGNSQVNNNASEKAKELHSVAVVDPDTVATQRSVWL